jgi:2-oxoglutarate ferredoxin oxidoreductase subunit delta
VNKNATLKDSKYMSKIVIDELRCKGCGLCTITCPKNLIALSEKINNQGYTPAIFDSTQAACTGCLLCAEICPDVAIMVFKE